MTTENFNKARANREEFEKVQLQHRKMDKLIKLAERAMRAQQTECYVSVQGPEADGNIATVGMSINVNEVITFLYNAQFEYSHRMKELDHELESL